MILLLLPAGVLAQQSTVPVTFHWTPSPTVTSEGQACAPAVAYEVYHQMDDGLIQLVATVESTVYTLQAEPGTHRIRVCGVDARDRTGYLSEWSDAYEVAEPEIPLSDELPPPVPTLAPNYPNPFNPETAIVYGVPETTNGPPRQSLEIYNIQGRRVRVLRTDPEPGWHEVRWTGQDDAGQMQPTGQYIVRYICNNRVQTTKMTMIK
ncbi:MAG: T9SS type A sorting domain-containing protein [bacterium]